jgi:hypothetical protein
MRREQKTSTREGIQTSKSEYLLVKEFSKRCGLAVNKTLFVEEIRVLKPARISLGPHRGCINPATLEPSQNGGQPVVNAASGINLLARPRDFGATWIRSLETIGRTTSPVHVKLTGARAFLVGATDVDPFVDVRAALDLTAARDKRQPRLISETDKLLEIAAPREVALIRVGSHGGLRISETVGL